MSNVKLLGAMMAFLVALALLTSGVLRLRGAQGARPQREAAWQMIGCSGLLLLMLLICALSEIAYDREHYHCDSEGCYYDDGANWDNYHRRK